MNVRMITRKCLIPALLFWIIALTLTATEKIPSNCPVLRADYRPPGKTVLARSNLGAITESELVMNLVINDHPDPNMFARFREEKDPRRKSLIRENLKKEILSYETVRRFSRQAPSSARGDIESLRMRYLMYPVYEWIWVDRVLKPQVKIEEMDIRSYYKRNRERYQRPASVKLQLMYLPASLDLPELERQKILGRIEDLREKAIAGQNFQLLVTQHSGSHPGTDPAGIMEIAKSDRYNRFYEEASALKKGDYSPVFQREEGFYFLRCLEKKEQIPIPLSEVREEIHRRLEAHALRFIYYMELDKLKKKFRSYTAGGNWDYIRPSQIMVKVKKFKMTKEEFWQLFPGVMKKEFTVDNRYIREMTRKIQNLETIRQDVERKKLDSDPLVSLGRRIAAENLSFQHYLDDRLASLKSATDQDLREHYEKKPELSFVRMWKETNQIKGEIVNPDQYKPPAFREIMEKMKKDFRSLLEEAAEKIEKKEKIVLPENLFKDLFRKYSTDQYVFDLNEMGRVYPDESPDVWKVLREIENGEFSEPATILHFIYCYLIVDSFAGKQLPLEDVRDSVEKDLVETRIQREKEKIRDISGLEFEPVLK